MTFFFIVWSRDRGRCRSATGAVPAIVAAMLLLAVAPPARAADLVIYSGRKESAFRPVVELFERTTGVRVALKTGKTSGLANEIVQERRRPRADVFVATEAGIAELLARQGLLEPYASPRSQGIAPEFKSDEGFWTGVSGRARVIIYNTRLVRDAEIPRSVLDVTDPRWRGKVAIAATRERTTLAWLAALLHVMGEAKARSYIDRLIANGLKIVPDNSDVWRGVGSGEFAIGLTNSPNYHLAREAGLPVGVVYPDQGPGDMGVLVNPNVVAIVRGARHLDLAKRFVDFVLSAEAQGVLVHRAFEIPLIPGTDPGAVRPMGSFTALKISQARLADLADRAITLFPGF
jgi:iron(III) transport system substrate-binding protein